MPDRARVPRAATGGKPEDVRRHNLGTLLAHLHESGTLSRAELTVRMGLNRSTIAGLVAELAQLDLVEEGPPVRDRAGVGRPSLMVRPHPDSVHVVAADIAVDRIAVALVGLGGRVLARRQRRFARGRSCREAVNRIRGMVAPVLAARTGRVVGMGVALPGVVRAADGLVRFAPNLGWVDEPLGELLQAAMADVIGHVRVRVGNDADLGVLAEHLRGVAVGHDDVVFVNGDVGVGGGCIIGGRLLHGAGGYAGELGHLPVVPDGRPCRCGARGCWETEIGGAAVARALGLPEASSSTVLRALRAGGGRSGAALLEVARFLGLGLAGVVNVLNPRLIILGGLLGDVYGVTEEAVRAALDDAALVAPAEQVRLVRPRLGGDSVLVGASELAWEKLLLDPVGLLAGAPRALS